MTELEFYKKLKPEIQKAAQDAIKLYNRSVDPNDNKKEIIKNQFENIEINLDTKKDNKLVDIDKASAIFGLAFSGLITPIISKHIISLIDTTKT